MVNASLTCLLAPYRWPGICRSFLLPPPSYDLLGKEQAHQAVPSTLQTLQTSMQVHRAGRKLLGSPCLQASEQFPKELVLELGLEGCSSL